MVAINITVVTIITTIILLSCIQNVCGCLVFNPYVCKADQQSENSPKKT